MFSKSVSTYYYVSNFFKAPSASPNNFEVTVVNTMVCSYWEPLPEDRRNGIIISYTLIYSFNANIIWHTMKGHVQSFCFDLRLENQELSCSVFASTAVGDGPPTDSITITTAGKEDICNITSFTVIIM